MGFVDSISRENSEMEKKSRSSLRNDSCVCVCVFLCTDSVACLEKRGLHRPRIAFSIFQIDGNKLKMRSARISFGPTRVFATEPYGVRTLHARHVYVCVRKTYVRMYIYAHMCLRITAGAFSYGARSAILISLHARILWSLQFQREHLYSLPLSLANPPFPLPTPFPCPSSSFS